MQTIKCVVVGDGAVGKAGPRLFHLPMPGLIPAPDLPVDLIYDKQVPQRIRANGLSSSFIIIFSCAFPEPVLFITGV